MAQLPEAQRLIITTWAANNQYAGVVQVNGGVGLYVSSQDTVLWTRSSLSQDKWDGSVNLSNGDVSGAAHIHDAEELNPQAIETHGLNHIMVHKAQDLAGVSIQHQCGM